ncbi:hypothetical protein DSOL_4818 [Desulfosporosinus metallidurans]|uniref:Uncharacterized protein n=1 Tax=Desulfosporosinus metallidurans TaxID=1888891 RepID=A0A1Q8QHS2_9FIRM|nr:hypothetical protein DSOL_4818 [Desulfosporosinus metallidurans]
MTQATIVKALGFYIAIGCTGYMLASMKNAYFHLLQKYVRLLWGWPHRFIKRIDDANSLFVLVEGDGQCTISS